MTQRQLTPLIACVDSSEDIVHLLAALMSGEGFRTVTHTTPIRNGPDDVVHFVRDLQPDVCIYSVSIPYRESWAEFQLLRAAIPNVPFVITTTNKRALDELVGGNDSIEIVGMPFDLDQICTAVRRALAGALVVT